MALRGCETTSGGVLIAQCRLPKHAAPPGTSSQSPNRPRGPGGDTSRDQVGAATLPAAGALGDAVRTERRGVAPAADDSVLASNWRRIDRAPSAGAQCRRPVRAPSPSAGYVQSSHTQGGELVATCRASAARLRARSHVGDQRSAKRTDGGGPPVPAEKKGEVRTHGFRHLTCALDERATHLPTLPSFRLPT